MTSSYILFGGGDININERDRLHWAQLREMRLAVIVALVAALTITAQVGAAPTENGSEKQVKH